MDINIPVINAAIGLLERTRGWLVRVFARKEINELKLKLLDAEEKTAVLRQENRELRLDSDPDRGFEFRDGVYWKNKEDGSSVGPFCAKCLNGNGKVCRMKRDEYGYTCLTCGAYVEHTPFPEIKQKYRTL